MLWGLVLQFMAGYFFLHSWHNLFGELLRFADREFYSVRRDSEPWQNIIFHLLVQDWWTCTSFSQFYRRWNLVVHDWIKAYIYQDLKDVGVNRNVPGGALLRCEVNVGGALLRCEVNVGGALWGRIFFLTHFGLRKFSDPKVQSAMMGVVYVQ
jgi:hypothetical protein